LQPFSLSSFLFQSTQQLKSEERKFATLEFISFLDGTAFMSFSLIGAIESNLEWFNFILIHPFGF